MEVEQATFKPLEFTTTGGMAPECQVYHKRLSEFLSVKKDEDYYLIIFTASPTKLLKFK